MCENVKVYEVNKFRWLYTRPTVRELNHMIIYRLTYQLDTCNIYHSHVQDGSQVTVYTLAKLGRAKRRT